MATPTTSTNLQDGAHRAQDMASDAFRTGRTATADMLDGAASKLTSGSDKMADAGHGMADRLGASASYVRDNGAKAMLADMETLVKAHPGKFLLGAIVVGFLAGRALSRD
ncbi:MAG: hypothetical protein HY275_01370 [Gemmatimonadetes bacterium]|nr:hypothetical protein [Gemmatimonadota bacterium]